MQKKFWCYQFRETKSPWAIGAIVSFPRGNEKKKKVAFDIYSELIPNDAHVLRVDSQRYDDTMIATNMLTDLIRCFYEVNEGDYKQIADFVVSILTKE